MSDERAEGSPEEPDLGDLVEAIGDSHEFTAILERIASSMIEDDRVPSFEDQISRLIAAEADFAPILAISQKIQLSARPALGDVIERLQDLAVRAAEPAVQQIRGQLDVILPNIAVHMQGTYTPPAEVADPEPTPANTSNFQSTRTLLIAAGGLYALVFSHLSDALDIDNKAHLQALAICITLTLLLTNEATKGD